MKIVKLTETHPFYNDLKKYPSVFHYFSTGQGQCLFSRIRYNTTDFISLIEDGIEVWNQTGYSVIYANFDQVKPWVEYSNNQYNF